MEQSQSGEGRDPGERGPLTEDQEGCGGTSQAREECSSEAERLPGRDEDLSAPGPELHLQPEPGVLQPGAPAQGPAALPYPVLPPAASPSPLPAHPHPLSRLPPRSLQLPHGPGVEALAAMTLSLCTD